MFIDTNSEREHKGKDNTKQALLPYFHCSPLKNNTKRKENETKR